MKKESAAKSEKAAADISDGFFADFWNLQKRTVAADGRCVRDFKFIGSPQQHGTATFLSIPLQIIAMTPGESVVNLWTDAQSTQER